MKRGAPDSEGGGESGGDEGGDGGGQPDAKRARPSAEEVRSLHAQLAAKDEEIAARKIVHEWAVANEAVASLSSERARLHL